MLRENQKEKNLVHKIWLRFKDSANGNEPSIILRNKETRCEFINSNCQIQHWDDHSADKFVREEMPEYYQLWQGYEFPIQRVDTLKYFLMYRRGGIYMDYDIECLKPFETYFDQNKVYLVEESSFISPYRFNNFLIASPKGHPFWLFVFKELEDGLENMKNFDFLDVLRILESTGPGVLQRAYEKYTMLNGSEDFHILPKELFNPCDACGNLSSSINSAYLIHESNVSWSDTAKLMTFLMCNSTVIGIGVIILILLFIYFSNQDAS